MTEENNTCTEKLDGELRQINIAVHRDGRRLGITAVIYSTGNERLITELHTLCDDKDVNRKLHAVIDAIWESL